MDYILHIATFALIYMLLAQSINLYLGYTNILALSHIAFMGIGGYTAAIMSLNGSPFWLGMLAGTLLALVLGILLGLTSIKLNADYLGITTLGFAMIVSSLFQNWSNLTRGPLGLPGIPRPELFGYTLTSKFSFFLFALIITLLLMLLMHRMVKSPYGRILEAIREDEIAAKSLGKNTTLYKLSVFAIGSAIAAIAGALYAYLIRYIDPRSFTIEQMAMVLTMTILGGLGTFRGPFIGVIILLFLQEGVTFLPLAPQFVGALQMVAYSLLFLLVMIFFPQGIGGFLRYKKRRQKQFTRY